jgi:uncharacterized protein (DUF1501 family)
MKRRQFIQSGSLISLPVMFGGLDIAAMGSSSKFQFNGEKEDNVLVIIQLNGGNDGLNMVIPIDQYQGLTEVRKPIIIPENKVLKLVDKTGLHPAMTGIQNLYQEGELAVIQAAGYPNQNRSHFRSTDIWTSASPADRYEHSGWMGRYFDDNYTNYPEGYPNADYPDPFAITLGSVVSETCQGEVANYSFALSSETSAKVIDLTEPAPTSTSCYGQKLDYVHMAVKQSNAYASTVLKALEKGSNTVTYPTGNRLGEQLRIVAKLISGGLKSKIYVVNLGGFDTHANQVAINDTLSGDHATLMTNLSSAISTFVEDCKGLGTYQKVMGMTFSEFGRQIRANNSYGTDHGTAAPLFIFGNCVNQGIYGHNPEINASIAPQEGVPMQNDFRSVYATLLIDWLGATESSVSNVLFSDFQRIPFVKNCSVPSGTDDTKNVITVDISPNPTVDSIIAKFDHPGGYLHVSVLDALGHLVHLQVAKEVGRGTHNLKIDLSNLQAGNYFVRIASRDQVRTSKVVKI